MDLIEVESAIGTLGEAERRNEWFGTATEPRPEIVSEVRRMRKSEGGGVLYPLCSAKSAQVTEKMGDGESLFAKECVRERKRRSYF
jgi:hypothetical protein